MFCLCCPRQWGNRGLVCKRISENRLRPYRKDKTKSRNTLKIKSISAEIIKKNNCFRLHKRLHRIPIAYIESQSLTCYTPLVARNLPSYISYRAVSRTSSTSAFPASRCGKGLLVLRIIIEISILLLVSSSKRLFDELAVRPNCVVTIFFAVHLACLSTKFCFKSS